MIGDGAVPYWSPVAKSEKGQSFGTDYSDSMLTPNLAGLGQVDANPVSGKNAGKIGAWVPVGLFRIMWRMLQSDVSFALRHWWLFCGLV